MKRKITSFILCLAMLVSIVAVLPIASAAADTTLAGTNVTLTDGVLLNFYIEADEAVDVTNAQLVDGQYIITEELAAKEMGKEVTVQLKNGETPVGEAYTSSVKEYAEGILASNDYDAVTKALVQAMLNYGAAAQKYFGYETDALVGTPETDTTALKAATVAPVAVEGDGFIGASLVLEGTMKLRFYFAGTVDAATVDGEEATVVANAAEYCYVDVKVTPDAIDKAYEVVAGETTVTYSVLNYLKNNADDAALSEMVASIYAYGVAADEYVLVQNCTHEGVEYEVTQRPTLFTEGKQIGYCEDCDKEVILAVDKTTPTVYTVNTSHNGNNAPNYTVKIGDIIGDEVFNPTAEDENGNDLYLEFSVLLTDELGRLHGPQFAFGGIATTNDVTKTNNGQIKHNFSYLYSKSDAKWCPFVGGMEFSEGGQYSLDGGATWKTYSTNNNNKEDFVVVDGYDGWHRIGLRYHQNFYEENGTFTYDVTIYLYVDGVQVGQQIMNWGDLFYSVERVDGDLVYTQNEDITDLYGIFYRYANAYLAEGDDDVYIAFADCILSVGDSFVLDVERVENPESATLEVEGGVELSAKAYYEVK